MNKNWIKIKNHEKQKIRGGISLAIAWGLGLLTLTVIRSLFSDKSNIAFNGIGKASWENNQEKEKKYTKIEKIDIALNEYFE